VTTKTVEGAAIRFDRPLAAETAAAPRFAETSLPDAVRRSASLRGLAIGAGLAAVTALTGLLFTLSAFGYSLGELL
jgi:hypothetical protein